MSKTLVLAAAACAVTLLTAAPAEAQRGGFGRGGGGFGGSDQERSERIRQFMEMRRQGGGGGFGGRGFGGGGGGSDQDRAERIRQFMEMRRQGGGGGDFGGGRGGFGGFGGPGGRDPRGPGKEEEAKPKQRIVLALPESYASGDLDKDGQIGMYEWKKWKSRAALREFLLLDRNHDGFLTPRELIYADKVGTQSLVASAGTSVAAAAAPAASAPTSSEPPTAAEKAAPSEGDAGLAAKRAARFFKIMDRDKNGKLEQAEWARSRSLKPVFEKAGIDLGQPMDEATFVGHYTKIVKK